MLGCHVLRVDRVVGIDDTVAIHVNTTGGLGIECNGLAAGISESRVSPNLRATAGGIEVRAARHGQRTGNRRVGLRSITLRCYRRWGSGIIQHQRIRARIDCGIEAVGHDIEVCSFCGYLLAIQRDRADVVGAHLL